MNIKLEDLERSKKIIAQFLKATPLIYSDYFSKKLKTHIYFKCEIFQPTKSFKVRGALSAILRLSKEEQKKGVVCASGGNHGLGVAYISNILGIPAEIYLPKTTPELKIQKIKDLNGIVYMYGDVWDEANKFAIAKAQSEGKAYIHAFDNPNVMSGQASMIFELKDQLPKVDKIICSIGGGGLISGILSARNLILPDTQVYGVETEGADCMAQSLAANKLIELKNISSQAESLGAKKSELSQFNIIKKYLDKNFVVTDQDAISALLELLQHEKIMVELAASCSLAALINGDISCKPKDNVVVILCGANIDLDKVIGFTKNKDKT